MRCFASGSGSRPWAAPFSLSWSGWTISYLSKLIPLSPGFRRAGGAPTSLPACGGALANYLKLKTLRPLAFSRTSPYRSKLLTALHEKSPALCAELQIVCGEGGIRTPGASQLNSFQDCRNRPLYHLSSMYPFGKGVQRYATIYYYASISPKKTLRILLTGLSPLTHAPPKVQCC